MKKIKTKYDYVVNLGGYVDHSNKTKTYNSHYIGCKNREVFKNRIKIFVQMGSSLEYGKNISPLKKFKVTQLQHMVDQNIFSSKFLLKNSEKKIFL